MSNIKEPLTGIIPALITAYTSTGEVDEGATRQLVQHLIAQGVDGFYACGSSGEAFLLSSEERMHSLEIIIDEAAGKVPVIAHVGALDTRTSISLAQHAAKAGAVAVSAVPPIYYKYGIDQLKQHFTDIAQASELPLIVYHFPDMSGVSPSPDFYKELSTIKGIIGIKYTSHNMFEMQQIMESCGPHFKMFNGYDEVLISGLAMGANAGIGSTYNIMPKQYIELRKQFNAGNMDQARKLQSEVNAVIRIMSQYNFIAFIREVLRLQGIETGESRKPLQRLTEAQRTEIQAALSTFSFLQLKQ